MKKRHLQAHASIKRSRRHPAVFGHRKLWCNAPSRNYFCATEIAESKKGIFSFPLVEMLLSPKGTKPLEKFLFGSKLTDFYFFLETNLALTNNWL